MIKLDHSFMERVSQFVPEWIELANRRTYMRRRAEYMGFTLGPALVYYAPSETMGSGVYLRGKFTCVCGRVEQYVHYIEPLALINNLQYRDEMLDPALLLHKLGSFSRSHLLEDGYTDDQVNDILDKGLFFDSYSGNPPSRTRAVSLGDMENWYYDGQRRIQDRCEYRQFRDESAHPRSGASGSSSVGRPTGPSGHGGAG